MHATICPGERSNEPREKRINPLNLVSVEGMDALRRELRIVYGWSADPVIVRLVIKNEPIAKFRPDAQNGFSTRSRSFWRRDNFSLSSQPKPERELESTTGAKAEASGDSTLLREIQMITWSRSSNQTEWPAGVSKSERRGGLVTLFYQSFFFLRRLR